MTVAPSVPLWSLREAAGFQAVRNSGVSVRQSPFVISALRVDDGLPPRLGLAIGKNVGNAVVRNTLRRQVKALLRTQADQLVGYLVTVRALPEAATISPGAVRQALLAGIPRVIARSIVSSRAEQQP